MTYDYRHRRVEQTYTPGGTGMPGSSSRSAASFTTAFQIIAEIDATQATLPVTSTYFWGYDTSHIPRRSRRDWRAFSSSTTIPTTSATFPATMQTATSCSSSGRVTANWMPNSSTTPTANLIPRRKADAVGQDPLPLPNEMGPRLRG